MIDPGKFALVIGDDRAIECESLGGDQQVVAAIG
jgi:hypothetical protein